MNEINWSAVFAQLRQDPADYHKLFPPAQPDHIALVEQAMGKLPDVLASMLRICDGAVLFNSVLTFFPVSINDQLRADDWSEVWCLDR